ncbi:hypothetical protein CJ739_2916 [Mariniflexile rhizosphaerae]|uniref:LamG-like jellyroll fold domain-containing protein n=1 Tax=unclassified Mariniflexile TaxID=2643887 RepID=UPI000CB41A2D|nr:LamG-like jellyroll fold domain-containing protein [Mariniflexile sp. TRM1-10]AXP81981.1 hypothetical protein CJ739_2916 [Mariniflexile sp. TRM1-10]PLB19161.1 MAG: Cell surface calcium-binding acidic-repeat protein [Flavobacteriaceae bacterium FS1-H7996/R]
MKKIAILPNSLVFILFSIFLSLNLYSQVTINSENFESNWGIWIDGGTDCSRNSSSPLNNSWSINLRDNTSSSVMTTSDIDLSTYSSITMTFDYRTSNFTTGEDFWIQFSNNSGTNWTTVKAYVGGTDFNNNTNYTNVTVTLDSSTYLFTANSRLRFQCDASDDSDLVYIDNIIVEGYTAPEIDITGAGNSIIGDGTNIPTINNSTDFGRVQIISEIATRTFKIHNTGTADLTVSDINLVGATEFSITDSPSFPATITPNNYVSFKVSFSTSTIGVQNDVINITSNDNNETLYQINISAEGSKVFYDSDNDGIYDDVDLDDDNDGIPDSVEENNCHLSSSASQATYKFLEESFGQGNRTTINTSYNAVTTYCYEDGTVGVNTAECPDLSQIDLNDGKYTVYYKAADGDGVNDTPNEEVASWADQYWYTGGDHTGNYQGRMAMFNASHEPKIFYTAHINGALPNIPITYSFWVLNLDTTTSPGIDTRLRPNIKVEFKDMDGNVLINTATGLDAVITTGDIPPSINGDPINSWHQFTASLTFNTSQFQVIFYNNEIGGLGNDLAIDDIEIRQTLCDMDSDGAADVFDLDSDNDGIPDVVEGNPTSASLSEGKATLTSISSWVDTNGNGMHDATEGIAPIHSDGDIIPDYLDLDSDNDGLFDVDEYGIISSSAPSGFQNGDGDITGNGVGDGPETEAFREKDSEGDGTIEYYGDGILDIYDFHHDSGTQNYINSYGNIGQGTSPLYALDSDGDGLPDYKDPYNNLTGIYDIDTMEIYAHLPNTAGVLDDTTDADGDGIMASRDGDDTVFGSPRNLDDSYSLYFDGRNDYVEDTNLISSGDATLMAFIKSAGDNTNLNNRMVAGQDDFYLRINTDNTVTAVADGVSLASTSTTSLGVWMHVAVTTTSGSTILYINGIEEASDTSGGITSTSNFTIGRASTNDNYFKGEIDEVRVFNTALAPNELKRMVYQELDDTNSFNRGKIIPIDISGSIGTNLVKYYKMDAYKDDILDDKKTGTIDQLTGAKMFNFKDIYFQRAPLPYETTADGDWTNTASWLHGSEWDITAKQDNPDDASIVHIKHNIQLDGTYNTQGTAGIIVETGKEFSIEADKGLYNSWYLKLDGLIDLDDESQLIQTEGSVLDVTSSGKIERDQQGSQDLFTYNYWSSPVGISNTISNNNSYRMIDNILKNGTIPATPTNITFLTSGYNGSIVGSNIKIADYWIWKYANKAFDNYSQWQHVRRTGTILAGEGYTMKGVANTGGAITLTQNYVFNGKPNNGDITLSIAAGNEYLVGNPYPSAIDADEFIRDNIKDGGNNTQNVINGVLYFWEHFASNSHVLAEYQGGYGVYTLMGGAEAINNDTRINYTGGLTSTKGNPQRYIPVGQGFFVNATDPLSSSVSQTEAVSGGTIVFKNSQRVFVKETPSTSIFIKNSNTKNKQSTLSNVDRDTRRKIRLKFDSPKGYHRQLLVGVDEKASNDFDLGYDALLTEDNKEDMFWIFNNNNFIIQAVNNFDAEQTLPLGVKVSKQGLASIKIDTLENMENSTNIYLHDKQLNIYHNLKERKYDVYLTVGKHLNRFEITFVNPQALHTDGLSNSAFQVYFSNENKSIIIHNPNLKHIASIEVFDILGQSMFEFKAITNENHIAYKPKSLSTGAYIIKLKTESGIISKKVFIE